MDMHEFFFPGKQALFEFDHSQVRQHIWFEPIKLTLGLSGQGHLKMADNMRCTGKMNLSFGGNQGMFKPSTLSEYDIGMAPAVLYYKTTADGVLWSRSHLQGYTARDCRVYAGQQQTFVFQVQDTPPWYAVPEKRGEKPGAAHVAKAKGMKQVRVFFFN